MMTIDFYAILLIAAVAQGSILVLALLTSKHGNKMANALLSGLIVLVSYVLFINILYHTGDIQMYPYLIRTHSPIPILIGLAIYFYSKMLTTPDFRFRAKDGFHLIPFGLYTLFLLPFFLSDNATKLQNLCSQKSSLFHSIDFWGQNILYLFYFVLSYTTLHRHQRHIKDVFSNLEKVKLNWLRNLVLVYGAICTISFLRALIGISSRTGFMTPLLLCLSIYLIGWYALRQPEIFKASLPEPVRKHEQGLTSVSVGDKQPSQQQPRSEERSKYEYSNLTSQDISTYKEQLLAYLENDKPYTNSELKVQDLANYLGIPSYQLSQLINTELNRNFYDLINSYRIEEAKRRLIAPANQHLTILAIAYDVGFNTKSAFNTAFKKYTHTTPSQYKQSHLTASHA